MSYDRAILAVALGPSSLHLTLTSTEGPAATSVTVTCPATGNTGPCGVWGGRQNPDDLTLTSAKGPAFF